MKRATPCRSCSAAKEISDGTISTADNLDPEFEEEFKVATVSQAFLARYYLRSLEMAVKNEPDPCFCPNDDQQVINLEHILPEKPGDNWPEFSAEVATAFFKRLGNMALLQARTNSDLRSSSFAEKSAVYGDSPYELTNQIAQVSKWETEAIAQRQAQMAALAVRTWPIKLN